MWYRIGLLAAGLLMANNIACTPPQRVRYVAPENLPDKWRTKAERTNYAETARYAETVDFCRRLAEASPTAHFTAFGFTAQGRPLPLLILSSEGAFTPAAARASAKSLILIQNCIHPGECAGKDASLALARDILITGVYADLLDHVNILIVPIFNADGHERFGPYNRINQNGPREMGWRVTADNLNLNRDYMKADAIEMRAWLRLWTSWQPDLLVDNHDTDGSEHRYDLMYAATTGPMVAPSISAWIEQTVYPQVLPAVETAGYGVIPYSWPRDPTNLSAGIDAAGAFEARYSTGYSALCNRPSILLEAHSYKPYERRVRSTYEFMLHLCMLLNRTPGELRTLVRHADAQSAAVRGGECDGRVPLRVDTAPTGRPIVYRGYAAHRRDSDISGSPIVEYTPTPVDVATTIYDGQQLASAVAPPAAYLVPPEWHDAIDRLELHGVEFFRLRKPQTLAIETYRFEDVKFADRPYESRQMVSYKAIPIHATRAFPVGTAVVPLDQPRAKLAVHLLEPDAPDSLLAWGLLNAIFEPKEYFEDYVMEPIARQMLADDPALRQAFEHELANDQDFARNPRRRLEFFYQRSPYWDEQLNVYPIARWMDAAALETVRRDESH